jgi:sterol desaturase/sphingolipid hydroxylase (fatty acid hydroxylase superfamily)
MLGIPLGLLYANAGEWAIHKYVLHGLGRDRKSPWSFHWHEHHRNTRLNDHIDSCYERPLFGWHSQGKEALGLAALAALHAPLLPVAPGFTGAVWYSMWNYYRVHKRAHQEPGWAREHLSWHYDHHMGPDQDCNWCVTKPWFDNWMGTRKPYVGTDRERQDEERRAARRAPSGPSSQTGHLPHLR